jgi:hypothetical protein
MRRLRCLFVTPGIPPEFDVTLEQFVRPLYARTSNVNLAQVALLSTHSPAVNCQASALDYCDGGRERRDDVTSLALSMIPTNPRSAEK